MFDSKKGNAQKSSKASVISQKIIAINFKENYFSFFNCKPKYYLEYTTEHNKKYKIYNPKKMLLESIFLHCFYFPNYKIKYLKKAFSDITESLRCNRRKMYFDFFVEDGKNTYVHVNDVAFYYNGVLNLEKNKKKSWIPLEIDETQKVSFAELIKFA